MRTYEEIVAEIIDERNINMTTFTTKSCPDCGKPMAESKGEKRENARMPRP